MLNSCWLHVDPLLTYYLDSEPTNLCSYSLMLCALQRRIMYKFYFLWFEPTIYDLYLPLSTIISFSGISRAQYLYIISIYQRNKLYNAYFSSIFFSSTISLVQSCFESKTRGCNNIQFLMARTTLAFYYRKNYPSSLH
jgi:hypothetical protein